MFQDNPDVQVLDYWYGQSEKDTLIRMPAFRIKQGIPNQADSSAGLTERGDYLFVKWKDKKTGDIFDEKADLRYRLPNDITDTKVYFIVKENKLFVYLVTYKPKAPDEVAVGPSKYWDSKNYLIYPN